MVHIYCSSYKVRDRGSTVVKVLYYKSEGRRFDPSAQPVQISREFSNGSGPALTNLEATK